MQEKKFDLNLNFKRMTDIMKAQYNIKTQNKSTKKMLIMMSIFISNFIIKYFFTSLLVFLLFIIS